MRKMTLPLALSFLIAVPVVAAAAPPEKEVLAALDTWKQAMMKKDRAAFEKVLHPDLTYGHASGLVETKEQAIQHVVGGAGTYVAITFTDTKVRVLGNTALVTGKTEYQERAHEKDSSTSLVVLSAWVKGSSGWQMIARQAAKPTPPAPAAAAAK